MSALTKPIGVRLVQCYGTSEGVAKGWETRKRGSGPTSSEIDQHGKAAHEKSAKADSDGTEDSHTDAAKAHADVADLYQRQAEVAGSPEESKGYSDKAVDHEAQKKKHYQKAVEHRNAAHAASKSSKKP